VVIKQSYSMIVRHFVEFCNGRWKREKYSIFWSGLGGRGN